MEVLKRVLGIVIIFLSVIFIVACLAGIFLSWSINTPITNVVTGVLNGVERVLTVADNGLGRVNTQLSEAQTNIDSIETNVEMAGETLSETSIVYEVLDRTVGDELFPKIAAASETILAIRDSVISFNEILESLDDLPFVSVPTLTEELETATDRMSAVQSDAQEMRTELQAIKEEAISKPVTAITDRTTRISEELGTAQQNLSNTQASIAEYIATVSSINDRVPGIIDLSSAALTLVFLWLAFGQVALILLAWNLVKAPMESDLADVIESAADK